MTCQNMALNREINTAGVFILGQSHHSNYNSIKSRKYSFGELSSSSSSPNEPPPSDSEFSNTVKASTRPRPTASSSSYLSSAGGGGGGSKNAEYYDRAPDAYDSYAAEANEYAAAYRDQSALYDGVVGADDKNEEFDLSVAFIGRLFNFNVWHSEKNASEVLALQTDCKLVHCGDAAQWSDYRQGTRGNVNMKWPTELLWKRDTTGGGGGGGGRSGGCFSERFQYETCNRHCNRVIGPICRENTERNIRWPLTKANVTQTRKCFPHLPASSRYAYRHCSSPPSDGSMVSDHASGTWQATNVDECVQEALLELKSDVYAFHTTDNFDETQIIGYLDRLYDLTVKHVRLNAAERSIFDISTLIDTMFYLVNAQVRSINVLFLRVCFLEFNMICFF